MMITEKENVFTVTKCLCRLVNWVSHAYWGSPNWDTAAISIWPLESRDNQSNLIYSTLS